ncbi:serine/threonine-protein kinase [Stutzerimonas azotifigens]|uniref:serine/threonine-protein kinase n=1 Tax=Stutzerimonas azotifigens TaxID=291995 RepID=UPI000409E221|nr:serine/threonine-protein kinase [Stutzerimonas azotifigens]
MNDALAAPASDLTYFAFAPAPEPSAAPREVPGPLPDTLCGRYRIERLLGVGGMGAVYRARDLLREQFGDPQPWVALKTLSDEFSEYPDAHALLYSEFALTTRLRHRHVVRPFAFEVDAASQRAFFTLELLKGPTLDQLLAEHPQGLAWPALQAIALPLLEALKHSHELGVLHGDIKPSNVMLAADGLRLFDYGLGHSPDGPLAGLPRLARHRIAAWTPRYAALELLDGAALTPAADLFALACVLYELSAGEHPYRRLNARQARSMALERTLAKPARLPAHCWPTLRRALALEPEARTATLDALLDDFRRTPRRFPWRWFAFSHG